METFMEYFWAFVIGGGFCLIGQLLIDLTKLTPARILVIYVIAGVVLGGCGVYEPLVDFAGAGATVPLTGFGYTLAKGVKQATGGFTAGAAGLTAAVVFGLIVARCFKRGDKMS